MDNWGREGTKNLRTIRSKNHASYPNITHVNPLYVSSIKNPEFNGNTSNKVKWQNLFSEKIKTVMQKQRLKFNANRNIYKQMILNVSRDRLSGLVSRGYRRQLRQSFPQFSTCYFLDTPELPNNKLV